VIPETLNVEARYWVNNEEYSSTAGSYNNVYGQSKYANLLTG
jgi:hypothetical protein